MEFKDLNSLGSKREPFLFITDFKASKLEVILLKDLKDSDVEFMIDEDFKPSIHKHFLQKMAIPFSEYKKKFDDVIKKIQSGDTYLLNLTQKTKIETDLTLKEIFRISNAHYKLRYKDKFVCFSPEKFIQIKDDRIDTYPMKGTIDASLDDAKNQILDDEKEMAEHIMVVDLLRNDISIMATDVKVDRFRYITEIGAGDKKLLQVSSHISGCVGDDWHSKIGSILESLLPAGSITGTPKKSTIKIIEDIEKYDRDFFTGVFGVYDGEKLDSGVMIRFIEKDGDSLVYKSGGGITLDSDAISEYNELLDKVYLP